MSNEELDISVDAAMPNNPMMTPTAPPLTNSGGCNNEQASYHSSEAPVMQSSPQHNNYRHSRAYRHFKNPPQPHMCIRTTTHTGEELFINVLSWTRIVIPQEPSDPIPLYGGMRVPPGSPRCPPLVYAVMANPEVLKDSGRHSKDPEERGAMVELMCDFVEAMNPGVKLTRNAVILKDRDISGELKDVWNAVQAQRDREREEQMVQQRQQQQHYHNLATTQQLFPKSQQPEQCHSQGQDENGQITQSNGDNNIFYVDLGPDTASSCSDLPSHQNNSSMDSPEGAQSAINNSANNSLTSVSEKSSDGTPTIDDQSDDVTDSKSQQNSSMQKVNNGSETTTVINSGQSETITTTSTSATNSTTDNSTAKTPTTTVAGPIQMATPTSPAATATTPPTKKEKLGGFLPNGCIFPRFKNNKNKEKDKEKESSKTPSKDKDKESSKTPSKDKEKTLLNALKKSKDKQSGGAVDNNGKTQYEKNCLNLGGDMEKLDLNKLDTSASPNNDNNMFIKLKVAATTGGK